MLITQPVRKLCRKVVGVFFHSPHGTEREVKIIWTTTVKQVVQKLHSLSHNVSIHGADRTYSKLENLIIHGLPTSMSEATCASLQPSEDKVHVVHEPSTTTQSSFLNLCSTKLGLNIRPTDISICHRLKKMEKMKYPPVIVRFTTHKASEAVSA